MNTKGIMLLLKKESALKVRNDFPDKCTFFESNEEKKVIVLVVSVPLEKIQQSLPNHSDVLYWEDPKPVTPAHRATSNNNDTES
jgi:hypothetical protein